LVSPSTGEAAKVDESGTWGSFDGAVDYYQKHCAYANPRTVAHGIGYVFVHDDPFTFTDGDHCCLDGVLTEIGSTLLTSTRSYAEWSVSGSGIHIISIADIPRCGRNDDFGGEFYNRERFAVFTGAVIDGCIDVLPEQTAISDLYSRFLPGYSVVERGGEKVLSISQGEWGVYSADKASGALASNVQVPGRSGERHGNGYTDEQVIGALRRDARAWRLWEGERSLHVSTSGVPDESRSDAALVSALLKYTRLNPVQTDRLFRRSGLFRPK
jgi:hypothetical protein